MEMRDAIEADAGRLAGLTDSPRDVMRNLVHDRTVRVVERDEKIVGFVSYDAREETVYITQIEGDRDIYDALFDEPVRFARSEDMAVEMLVPDNQEVVREVARAVGFEETGSGPRFAGEPTTRLRIENP